MTKADREINLRFKRKLEAPTVETEDQYTVCKTITMYGYKVLG